MWVQNWRGVGARGGGGLRSREADMQPSLATNLLVLPDNAHPLQSVRRTCSIGAAGC